MLNKRKTGWKLWENRWSINNSSNRNKQSRDTMPKSQLAADTQELIFSVYILLPLYLPGASQEKKKEQRRRAAAATDEQSVLPTVMLSFLKTVGSTYLLFCKMCAVLSASSIATASQGMPMNKHTHWTVFYFVRSKPCSQHIVHGSWCPDLLILILKVNCEQVCSAFYFIWRPGSSLNATWEAVKEFEGNFLSSDSWLDINWE